MKKISILALMCIVAALAATAQDSFYISDFTIAPGETKTVEMFLDNATEFTALQADITLPEGLTIEQEDGEYLFDLTDRKARNHTVSSTTLSTGAIRILIASQTLKTFSGNSGALVTFNIIADASFSGTKTLKIKNIIASEVDRTEHNLSDVDCIVTQEGYTPPEPPVGEDRFYINDFTINPGETKEVEMILDNATEFTALQADITLPEGLTIEQEDDEYIFDLTDRKARNHTISSTTLSTGDIRILIASQTLKTFSGNSGALVTFNIIADASFSGTKTLKIKNIIASEVDRTEHNLPDVDCIVTQEGYTPPEPPVGEDRFYINDFTINPGETKEVEMILDNATEFTALQADITLPEGLTIEQEDGEYIFDLTDRKARNHTISSTTLSTGDIRILIASQTLKTFSGNSGALVTFNITADASFSGTKTLQIKNIIASEVDRTEHNLPAVDCVVTAEGGNVPPVVETLTLNEQLVQLDVDETVTLACTTEGIGAVTWATSDPEVATVDANGVVTAVAPGLVAITASAANGASAWCAVAVELQGDVNRDGGVDVADITRLVNILLSKEE